jgi:hypothetical protein
MIKAMTKTTELKNLVAQRIAEIVAAQQSNQQNSTPIVIPRRVFTGNSAKPTAAAPSATAKPAATGRAAKPTVSATPVVSSAVTTGRAATAIPATPAKPTAAASSATAKPTATGRAAKPTVTATPIVSSAVTTGRAATANPANPANPAKVEEAGKTAGPSLNAVGRTGPSSASADYRWQPSNSSSSGNANPEATSSAARIKKFTTLAEAGYEASGTMPRLWRTDDRPPERIKAAEGFTLKVPALKKGSLTMLIQDPAGLAVEHVRNGASIGLISTAADTNGGGYSKKYFYQIEPRVAITQYVAANCPDVYTTSSADTWTVETLNDAEHLAIAPDPLRTQEIDFFTTIPLTWITHYSIGDAAHFVPINWTKIPSLLNI